MCLIQLPPVIKPGARLSNAFQSFFLCFMIDSVIIKILFQRDDLLIFSFFPAGKDTGSKKQGYNGGKWINRTTTHAGKVDVI